MIYFYEYVLFWENMYINVEDEYNPIVIFILRICLMITNGFKLFLFYSTHILNFMTLNCNEKAVLKYLIECFWDLCNNVLLNVFIFIFVFINNIYKILIIFIY